MNGGDFRSLQTSRREPACHVLPVTELARAGDERESKKRVSWRGLEEHNEHLSGTARDPLQDQKAYEGTWLSRAQMTSTRFLT